MGQGWGGVVEYMYIYIFKGLDWVLGEANYKIVLQLHGFLFLFYF